MKRLLLSLLLAIPLLLQGAETGAVVPIEALVDEAIQRPGDGSQICDAPEPVPFSPPIPVYGLAVSQSTYLSEPMKKLLKERRAEVVAELGRRLEKLDLMNPPPAPAKRKKPLLPPLYPPAKPDEVEFETETKQNPRTLGGVMLTIILELDAVEVLPHMLKLEEQLHGIIKAAVLSEKAPLPKLETGGYISWEGQGEEFKDVEDWDKLPAKLKRRQQLFDTQVFDREMLGVMVELLHRKEFEPLSTSTLGRISTLRLRTRVLDEELQKIRTEKDIPAEQKDSIAFDKNAGVPYWRWQIARAPFSEELRGETRGLVEAFLNGTKPPVATGAQVLDAAIAVPGNYSQMCSFPAPVAFDVPIPAYGELAPRHFSMDSVTILKLQAYRDDVVPALVGKLKAIDLMKGTPAAAPAPTDAGSTGWPKSSGADPNALTGLLLEAVNATQAVECLPELLRLEAQLHELLAAAEKNANAALPVLKLDSPVRWLDSGKVEGSKADQERKYLLYQCRIIHRELLGLTGLLLRRENFAPLLATSVDKVYGEGLKRAALEGELKEITSPDDIPWESRHWISWDAKLGIPVYTSGRVVQVPYTEAARDELRQVAKTYLETVPAEKRLGAKAMPGNAEPGL